MDILEDIDDAIDDYEQWNGLSPDAARWPAGPRFPRPPQVVIDLSQVTAAMRLMVQQMVVAARRANEVLKPLMRLMAGMPAPPPPKVESGMTARQYRAARRAYTREFRAWLRSR